MFFVSFFACLFKWMKEVTGESKIVACQLPGMLHHNITESYKHEVSYKYANQRLLLA